MVWGYAMYKNAQPVIANQTWHENAQDKSYCRY
jgi:hypothetical protein